MTLLDYKLKLKAAIEAEVELTWNEFDMSRATFMHLNKHDVLRIQAGQMQRMVQAIDILAANNFKQICEAQLKLIEVIVKIQETRWRDVDDNESLLLEILDIAKQALAELTKGEK